MANERRSSPCRKNVERDDPRQRYYPYTRALKSGKKVWYFKFRDPVSGTILPGKSSHHMNQSRARDWADEEYERLFGRDAKTVYEFVQPFYSEDCPYVRKQRNTKGMSEKTRKQKRTYVEDYILTCSDLMERQLSDVTRQDLESFRDDYLIAERFEDEPCRTSQAIMEVVKTIFGQAVQQGKITQNPVYRLPTGKYDALTREALTEKQLDRLIKRTNFGSDRQYRATMVAALTGMRAGEVRGLQFRDLDTKKGIIRIDRALQNENSVVGLPKWGKRRICPYPKKLQELLKPLKGAPEEYVFAWEETETLNYRRWKDAFYMACAKAGVSTTLHGLRHTLNTILLLRGIPDPVIRAALGWSDPRIQARYTHITFGREPYHSPLIDSVVEAIQGKPQAKRTK